MDENRVLTCELTLRRARMEAELVGGNEAVLDAMDEVVRELKDLIDRGEDDAAELKAVEDERDGFRDDLDNARAALERIDGEEWRDANGNKLEDDADFVAFVRALA